MNYSDIAWSLPPVGMVNEMSAYILRRLLLNIPVLLLVSMAVFMLVRILPGDEITARVAESGNLRPGDIAKLRQTLGLDKPFYEAYPEWLGGAVHGDFGTSVRSGVSVSSRLSQTLPVTTELTVLAVILACAIGLPTGVISAVYRNSPIDLLVRLIAVAGLSMPSFWTGTLAFVLPAFWWHYLPPLTYVGLFASPPNNLRILFIPAAAIGLGTGAVISRMVRSMMLEVLHEDYVRTARAKGLSQRVVILRHTLRNAMIPIIEVIARQFGVLIGGTVILESIFSLPGTGRLTLTSIQQRDYPQIQVNALFFAVVLVIVNLGVDIIYATLDPRIRYD
jgi:peptide/nickel transport system permease protein